MKKDSERFYMVYAHYNSGEIVEYLKGKDAVQKYIDDNDFDVYMIYENVTGDFKEGGEN